MGGKSAVQEHKKDSKQTGVLCFPLENCIKRVCIFPFIAHFYANIWMHMVKIATKKMVSITFYRYRLSFYGTSTRKGLVLMVVLCCVGVGVCVRMHTCDT